MWNEVNLQHSCGHWQKWRIPARVREAGIYVAAIRNTPCPSCHLRETAAKPPPESLGEAYRGYARTFLRSETG